MKRTRRLPLTGCHVLSLRPVGGHAALRRAAAAQGARVLALSPWRIEVQDDAATRRALAAALAADVVITTSPAAVRAALQLRALHQRRGQAWCAVGAGTASALRRAGIANVAAPARMDSEGLLALAELQSLRGRSVGLLTAPGGRGVIAPSLRKRGAKLLRADVYARIDIAPSSLAMQRLRALRTTPWLALSSSDALQVVLSRLPDDLANRLRNAHVAAASERLAQAARDAGFRGRVMVAASARPRDLVAAMVGAAKS